MHGPYICRWQFNTATLGTFGFWGGSLFQFYVLVLAGFCMFYCFDGLLRERPFEILAYVAASTVIIVYIIANFSVTGWEEQPLRIVSQVALTP